MAQDPSITHQAKRPWFLTLLGLVLIGALLSLPFIEIAGDSGEVSDSVRFVGHFHPLVLHLPIGIFVLLSLQEFGLMLMRKKPAEASGIGFPMAFGVFSAILAVIAGYLLLKGGAADYEGNDLAERHLWGGVVFASAAVATAMLKAWSLALSWRPASYRWPLFLSVGIMSFASHDGASMTHGSDYLTQYAPDPVRQLLGLEAKKKANLEPLVYEDVIQPIFERRCVQCHKEGKSKGQFRMDTYELLVKGGKEGRAVEPGDSAASNIVLRMSLPLDDEEHMPPEGKPQIEDDELLVIKWWIDQGSDPTSKLADVALPAEIVSIVASLLELPPVVAGSGHGSAMPLGHEKPDAELVALVERLSERFPGAVAFESQQSSKVALSAVSLRGTLDDEEFKAFIPLIPHLVSADLSATLISDKSVALLEKAEGLRMLRLAETQISDRALRTLQGIPSLESLNLYGTAVTDRGIGRLAGLQNLKRLYLWQTSVTEQGVKTLSESLPECEIVLGAVSSNPDE